MFLQFFVFHEQQILKQGNVDLSTTLEMTMGALEMISVTNKRHL